MNECLISKMETGWLCVTLCCEDCWESITFCISLESTRDNWLICLCKYFEKYKFICVNISQHYSSCWKTIFPLFWHIMFIKSSQIMVKWQMSLQLLKSISFIEVLNQKHRRMNKSMGKTDTFLYSIIEGFYLFMVTTFKWRDLLVLMEVMGEMVSVSWIINIRRKCQFFSLLAHFVAMTTECKVLS